MQGNIKLLKHDLLWDADSIIFCHVKHVCFNEGAENLFLFGRNGVA